MSKFDQKSYSKEKYDIGDGKKATLSEIIKMTGLPYTTIYARINKGFTGKDLIAKNIRNSVGVLGRKVELHGKKYTVQELANKYNLKPTTLYRRIEVGYEGEDLVKPILQRGRPVKKDKKENEDE